ncbi:MAG: ABC transporter substrate-binding protein, partial [Actinomycetota bacterium]|nr:ABC transporter substrate-binding protein [Actinomycetota bacterium]
MRPALCASAVITLLVAAAPSHAVDDDRGSAGFCPGEDGVTVVVDFQGLGGDSIVRCASGSQPRTGLEALKAAGFQVDGVQRWGEAFICRIEDRPSAAEELPLAGHEDYREACIDTPPNTGYWGYFHAEDGGEWVYSGAGGKNRSVVPGGFEGWSFALNAQDGHGPAPGVVPARDAPAVQRG